MITILKRLIACLLISSFILPDIARCMEQEERGSVAKKNFFEKNRGTLRDFYSKSSNAPVKEEDEGFDGYTSFCDIFSSEKSLPNEDKGLPAPASFKGKLDHPLVILLVEDILKNYQPNDQDNHVYTVQKKAAIAGVGFVALASAVSSYLLINGLMREFHDKITPLISISVGSFGVLTQLIDGFNAVEFVKKGGPKLAIVTDKDEKKLIFKNMPLRYKACIRVSQFFACCSLLLLGGLILDMVSSIQLETGLSKSAELSLTSSFLIITGTTLLDNILTSIANWQTEILSNLPGDHPDKKAIVLYFLRLLRETLCNTSKEKESSLYNTDPFVAIDLTEIPISNCDPQMSGDVSSQTVTNSKFINEIMSKSVSRVCVETVSEDYERLRDTKESFVNRWGRRFLMICVTPYFPIFFQAARDALSTLAPPSDTTQGRVAGLSPIALNLVLGGITVLAVFPLIHAFHHSIQFPSRASNQNRTLPGVLAFINSVVRSAILSSVVYVVSVKNWERTFQVLALGGVSITSFASTYKNSLQPMGRLLKTMNSLCPKDVQGERSIRNWQKDKRFLESILWTLKPSNPSVMVELFGNHRMTKDTLAEAQYRFQQSRGRKNSTKKKSGIRPGNLLYISVFRRGTLGVYEDIQPLMEIEYSQYSSREKKEEKEESLSISPLPVGSKWFISRYEGLSPEQRILEEALDDAGL